MAKLFLSDMRYALLCPMQFVQEYVPRQVVYIIARQAARIITMVVLPPSRIG